MKIEFLFKNLFPLIFLFSINTCFAFTGFYEYDNNWSLFCDNTGTCRAIGYPSYDGSNESIIFTREAGEHASIQVEYQNINWKPTHITINEQVVNINPLTQVNELVSNMIQTDEIAIRSQLQEDSFWINTANIKEIFSQMDSYQGRTNTSSAIIHKGSESVNTIFPPKPIPEIVNRAPQIKFKKIVKNSLAYQLFSSLFYHDIDDDSDTCDDQYEIYLSELGNGSYLVASSLDNTGEQDGITEYIGHFWHFNVNTPNDIKEIGSAFIDFKSQVHLLDEELKVVLVFDGEKFDLAKQESGMSLPTYISHIRHEPYHIDNSFHLFDVETAVSTESSYAVLMKSGLLLGMNVSEQCHHQINILPNIKSVVSTRYAFAALTRDDDVITWSYEHEGKYWEDDSANIQHELTNIKLISSTAHHFLILKNDGNILIFDSEHSEKVFNMKNTNKVISSEFSFAILEDNGTATIWPSDDPLILSNIQYLINTARTGVAYAAIKNDGTVVTWGKNNSGGNSSSVQPLLTNVVSIASTYDAFAALRKNGTIVAWGDDYYGGQLPIRLTDIKSISSNGASFVALNNDGTAYVWGEVSEKDKYLVSQLTDIKNVYSSEGVHVFLKKDDTAVVMTGDPDNLKLSNIEAIYPSTHSIVVLFKTGSTILI